MAPSPRSSATPPLIDFETDAHSESRSSGSPSSRSGNVVLTPRTSSSGSITSSRSNGGTPQFGENTNTNISSYMRNLRLSGSVSPAPSFDLRSLSDALGHANAPAASPSPRPERAGGPSAPRPSNPRARRSSPRLAPARHNVADEEPPEDRFHQPEFQRAFGEARTLMGNLARVLGSSAVHIEPDSTIQSLRRKADDLAAFQCPPTRTVGLVGDSGVGMVPELCLSCWSLSNPFLVW